jgi:hypothetical protein
MLRPLGRGLRDTLDNLLPFTLASMSWWAGLLLIVTAPAATLALLARCDPRRLEDHLALTRDEVLGVVRRELLRGWIIAIAFGLPTLVLVNNLVAYRDAGGAVRWLQPLWVLLLLLVVSAAGAAGSLRAVHGQPVGSAIGVGVVMTLARAHHVLPVTVVLWVIVAIGGVMVIPAIMFIPALVAVTVNHLVYDALGIPIVDPLAPTDERRHEDEVSRGGKYSVG